MRKDPRPKVVKEKIATEDQEQASLIEWARLKGIDLVHNANQRQCTPRQGSRLKDLGLAPGYPDLTLNEARGGYFGLFIELKQKRHYTDCERQARSWLAQSEWLTKLANNHYFAIRCFGWDHAREVVEMYVSWLPTPFNPMSKIANYGK